VGRGAGRKEESCEGKELDDEEEDKDEDDDREAEKMAERILAEEQLENRLR